MKWIELFPSGEEEVDGSKEDFFSSLYRFMPARRIPPFSVIEAILVEGQIAGGMEGGVKWDRDSISLSKDEYQRIFLSAGGRELEFEAHYESYNSWVAAVFEEEYGIDYKLHIQFLNRISDMEVSKDKDDPAYLSLLSDYSRFVSDALRRK